MLRTAAIHNLEEVTANFWSLPAALRPPFRGFCQAQSRETRPILGFFYSVNVQCALVDG